MFAFAAIGILVMVALALKLPNDNPGYQARGVVTSEPYSSAPSSNSLKEEDDDGAEETSLPPRLRWGDERIKPWLITGILGGNAHALILGRCRLSCARPARLARRPEMGIRMTGIVLMSGAAATLLAQWGLIRCCNWGRGTSILWGLVLGAFGCLLIGLSHDLHGIIIGFAVASLGFGLFRPGFTAGASLAVKRSEQNGVAGIVASVNGMAFIASPAFGVLLYTYADPCPSGWRPASVFSCSAGVSRRSNWTTGFSPTTKGRI